MNDKIFENVNKGALSFFLISAAVALISIAIPASEKKDYAYIEFDGGYTALGYIAGISYDMSVTIEDDDGEVYASGKEEVVEILNTLEAGETVLEGLFLEFNNSFEYTGSVSDFSLTINQTKSYSDGTTTADEWLSLVNSTEVDEKSNYRREAEGYLDFQAAPGGSNPLAFLTNLL
jgi:hypothetical protein